jgi:protein-S-isoprenylcysteine O-methyltransferase Ste14
MRAAPGAKTVWQRFARRARVPLGFVVAAVFLVFAHPTVDTLLGSLVLVLPGLWLRAYAGGYVKKNAELTRTGPYAHTRNPLYLGSMGMMFLAIYVPTIRSEEAFLRATFPEFVDYARRVPRFHWRLSAAEFPDAGPVAGHFSRQRYVHHREYNAAMGAAAIYGALTLRMMLWR